MTMRRCACGLLLLAATIARTASASPASSDPFGVVFNSATGAGMGGVSVLLFSVDRGAPAQVFCDDGATPCPNPQVTPAAPSHDPRLGSLPAGGFRFPRVAPGDYRIQVTPPSGFAAPSVSAAPYPPDAATGRPHTIVRGSRGEQFTVPPGPAINVDVPLDPAGFLLGKTVSQAVAGIGDYLQYQLTLQNLRPAAATHTVIADLVPQGFRYQGGSLRIDGVKQPDPAPGPDGRTLTLALGTVAANQTVRVSYVLSVSAGTPTGTAVNSAIASADGPVVSNTAQAAVDVRDALMLGRFTIIGELACHPPSGPRTGVPNVRVLLDDGTSVTSDQDGLFHFEGVREGTHVVQVDLATLPPGYALVPRIQNTRFAGRSYSQFVEVKSGGLWRTDFEACPDNAARISPPVATQQQSSAGAAPAESHASAGADPLAGEAPGVEWLLPAGDVPVGTTTRIAIKHKSNQTAVLKYIPGEADSGLAFEGTQVGANGQVAVSRWRNAPLVEGVNRFEAQIIENGKIVETLHKVVHHERRPAHAELVAERSNLVADGIHKPVIALRIFDANGAPLPAGASGTFSVEPPYLAAETVQQMQQRQLAGPDRFAPAWRVESNDGVALIELAPSSDSGTATLNLAFEPALSGARPQTLRVGLDPQPRDWIVVGFAEGTVGYNTLRANQVPLPPGAPEDKGYSDGKVSLYAKGRVLGQWLLTLAYDSDKPEQRRRRESLLSTIDPQSFYTLYGDGSQQRYDAASQDKLYLKLERGTFYALFGDYDTGLAGTQLSRYRRTLQGAKAELGGDGPLQFTAFAADTPLHYAHDEIQGNGSSGLYHLRSTGIVQNSEHIRIETRDRLHGERIVGTRTLARHVDYDIDYDAGTLFFHEPVYSRDSAFNPVFIVAEYETFGTADSELNAGGRVGTTLPLGSATLRAGVTGVHEDSTVNQGDLGGVDAKLTLADGTEVRIEGAASHGSAGTVDRQGRASLVEVERHAGALDFLAYGRRLAPQFGLGQQGFSEGGMEKVGADGRIGLTEHVSLLGSVFRQDNLGADLTREAGSGQVEYRTEDGAVRFGGQYAHDEARSGALAGHDFESQQLTASGNRWFLDRALELSASADASLGGQNDSADFPSRYRVGAAYAVSDDVRLIAAEEFTDSEAYSALTTRVGMQAVPWKGARLTSTVNQTDMGEYGPRSFGLFGLTQALLVGENLSFDVGVDTCRAFAENGAPLPQPNAAQPLAGGGSFDSGVLTEDFVALSGGATYRSERWSWNGRAESRDGEQSDRYGFTTAFLRQASAGVAFSLDARAFRVNQAHQARGLYGGAGMGWAWRPLAARYAVLDRFELRYDDLRNGSGVPGSGLFGNTSLAAAGHALSRRLVNNFSVNYVAQEWTAQDRVGNLFQLSQRDQWAFYYGAKYAIDRYDGEYQHGYTDLTGLEWRWDWKTWLDLGLQAGVLHDWDARALRYSYGPQFGVSPAANGWVTIGWNIQGFRDRDFEAARYSAQGPYLTLRFKFDQNTKLFER